MRKDFYQALCDFKEQAQNSGEWEQMDAEERRFTDKIIREMKRSGLSLPDDVKN